MTSSSSLMGRSKVWSRTTNKTLRRKISAVVASSSFASPPSALIPFVKLSSRRHAGLEVRRDIIKVTRPDRKRYEIK